MGRKGTPETLRQLLCRLARENSWGYGRIVGELRKLRIHCVRRITVRTILKEEGITPKPKSGCGTWDEFVKIHAKTLWQVDFFSKMATLTTSSAWGSEAPSLGKSARCVGTRSRIGPQVEIDVAVLHLPTLPWFHRYRGLDWSLRHRARRSPPTQLPAHSD